MSAGEKRRAYQGPVFLSHGFRPFFFLGACFAALAIPLWIGAFVWGYDLGGGALRWHVHEMLYGYLAAIIAGFLLTAIPNWTGRLPVMGLPLGLFVLVWVAGRATMAFGAGPVAGVIDCAFLIMLAGFVWREILRGRNWRNLPVCILVSLFALGNILFHAEAPLGLYNAAGQRLGFGIAIMLMALIGGRIIPSFTTNWLKKHQAEHLPAPFGGFDKATLLITAILAIGWVVAPSYAPLGYGLVFAGALHGLRVARWRGWAARSEPLVAILHIAYLWLAAAIAAIGFSIVRPELVAQSLALHLLTAGAIGQLTMAVMTRASLGHCGRALVAGRATIAIYFLIFAGALLRIILPATSIDYGLAMALAGLVWCSGFLAFAIFYGPMLFRPRSH